MVGKTKRKKKKKPRRHFKFNLERMGLHIGKMVDKTSLKELGELVLNIGLAYAGVEAFKVGDKRQWQHALIGPIGLKLATAPAGTPPVAQTAGLAILASLGFSALSPDMRKVVLEESLQGPYGVFGALNIPLEPKDLAYAPFGILGSIVRHFAEAEP